MRFRFRIVNIVDFSRPFAVFMRGGERGYPDAMALDTVSNDFVSTIRTISSFNYVVIPLPNIIYKTCAVRGRCDGNWHTSEHQQCLEIGCDIANSITSVQKDSLVIELHDDN